MLYFILTAILCQIASLFSFFLAPIAALTCDKHGRLHWLFWWMETHDYLGWSGPLSENYPATKWGLCRWLWRNKVYALRNEFRANPSDEQLKNLKPSIYEGNIFFFEKYVIGRWFEYKIGFKTKYFKIWFVIGWKLKPYFDGHRPQGPTATGILIPFSIRSDDFDG